MLIQDTPIVKKNIPVRAIMPDTAKDFQCIMSACEDNCCRNTTWSITVDPDSYKKYQGLNNETGQRILDCIEDTGTVLKFREFDDGKCPLMLDTGLCYIHKELGAEYLCKTCASYPRVHNSFNKKVEYWLSLSCPEVVRHVLYGKKSTSFIDVSFTVQGFPETKPQDAEKALVRDMLAKIISYRKLTLKEKMLYMGVFMRSMSKLTIYMPDYTRKVKKSIKTYTNDLSDARKKLGEVVEKTGSIPADSRGVILQTLAILSLQVSIPPKLHPEGIENAKYYTLMGNFHEDVASGASGKYIADTFDTKIVPYINSKPHVFENYLMYVLLSSRFLAETNDFAKAYAGFAAEFASMLVFACMFHEADTFGDEEMVAAMYLFHRRISHNQQLRKALAERFSDSLLVFLLSALGRIK